MFSCRFDQIYPEMIYNDSEADSEITMMEIFDEFTERFECENFIFAFEDKDKTGQFPRKPHYHSMFKSPCKPDTMRRYLKKMGFHGDTAGIHKIKDDEEWEKTTMYTLKQQSVVFTDIDHTILDSLQKASAEYNFELDKSKNIAVEVLEQVITKCKEIMKGTSSEVTRLTIAELIYDSYCEINNTATNWSQYYCIPTGQQLLRMIHYVETHVVIDPRSRWLTDNMFVVNPSQDRENKRLTKVINSYKEIYDSD